MASIVATPSPHLCSPTSLRTRRSRRPFPTPDGQRCSRQLAAIATNLPVLPLPCDEDELPF